MSLYLLREPATSEQVRAMLANLEVMIKVVVDVNREVMAGGGDMHYEGEQLLLDDGSKQSGLWGENWYPDRQTVEFEALINIRPRDSNPSMIIQNTEIRQKVETVIRHYLEGVQP